MATDAKTGQPIFKGATAVGLRNVGSYQVSGHPYMTGALLYNGANEYKISFPYITKKITVTLSGTLSGAGIQNQLRIHFVSTGSSHSVSGNYHYAFLDTHEDSQDFDVKCKEMYVSTVSGLTATDAAFFVYASLTNIPTSSMYELTGSGVTEETFVAPL